MNTRAWQTTQYSLDEYCEHLASRAMDGVTIPLVNAIERAASDYRSLQTRVESERAQAIAALAEGDRQDISHLQRVRTHFHGVDLPDTATAVAERVRVVAPTDRQSPDGVDIELLAQHALASPGIPCSVQKQWSNWLGAYGFVTFVPLILALGFTIPSWGFAFFVALIATSSAPAVYFSAQHNRAATLWSSLIDLAARGRCRRNLRELPLLQTDWELMLQGGRTGLQNVVGAAVAQAESDFRRLQADIDRALEAGGMVVRPFDAPEWRQWQAPGSDLEPIRLGEARIDIPAAEQLLPEASNFPDLRGRLVNLLNELGQIRLPSLLALPEGRSVYLRVEQGGDLQAGYRLARHCILRLMCHSRPGSVKFLVADPVELGRNVQDVLAVNDAGAALIEHKLLTGQREIEDKLSEYIAHIEWVIQHCLRDVHPDIDAYNETVGDLAIPYRVAVLFDFPQNVTPAALQHLERITQVGGRCGVFAVVLHNTSREALHGVTADPLLPQAFCVTSGPSGIHWNPRAMGTAGLPLQPAGNQKAALKTFPDPDPRTSIVQKIVARVGAAAAKAQEIEIPYVELLERVSLKGSSVWSGDSTYGLEIPVGIGQGRTVQELKFGVDLAESAVVVGRPRSGKTNLMRVIINTAALKYSPAELQMYLLDLKEGVGFKRYADGSLPHARVVAIRTDCEFAVSALEHLHGEIERRSELFREAGVDKIADYRQRRVGGTLAAMPRLLLVLDEFQELFHARDVFAERAGVVLENLVRQGPAYGIHIILASQTFTRNSIPRAVLDLITVRIALKCTEDDSRTVLSDNNVAGAQLRAGGSAIYNADAGGLSANRSFQVALIDERSPALALAIAEVQQRIHVPGAADPVVFEGFSPVAIHQCKGLIDQLLSPMPETVPPAIRVCLGMPVAIGGGVAAVLERNDEDNLLIVAEDTMPSQNIFIANALGVVSQFPAGAVEITLVDGYVGNVSGPTVTSTIEAAGGLPAVRVVDARAAERVIEALDALLEARKTGGGGVETVQVLMIHGLERMRSLWQVEKGFSLRRQDEDEPGASAKLAAILQDGPRHGVHVFASCNRFGAARRALGRDLLNTFNIRIAGRMGSDDSMGLIQCNLAANISMSHRMIKYDGSSGETQAFLPFAAPDAKELLALKNLLGR